MAKKRKGDELLFHDKVVAAEDLIGVPAGTPGKVTLVNGFRWIRYRVYFDNGVDMGTLDRSQLMLRKEWEAKERDREAATLEAELDARAAALAAPSTTD